MQVLTETTVEAGAVTVTLGAETVVPGAYTVVPDTTVEPGAVVVRTTGGAVRVAVKDVVTPETTVQKTVMPGAVLVVPGAVTVTAGAVMVVPGMV